MQFDGRGMQIQLTYDLLERFSRKLNMPFETAPNEMNIIILRGAKTVSPITDMVVNTPQETADQVNWFLQEGQQGTDECYTIELADDKLNRYNDVSVFVWVDDQNRPHVRAVLVSADPGRHYIENPMVPGGAASLAPGSYRAEWSRHGAIRYDCLILKKNGSTSFSGRRISRYRIDDKGTATRSDDEIIVLEYTYTNIGGIQMHAGGIPPNLVHNWSGGCIVIAGAETSRIRGDVYREVMENAGWLQETEGGPQLQNIVRFKVIVWNAWSLYQFSLPGRRFRPMIEFGTNDLSDKLPGLEMEAVLWVRKMQEKLNEKRGILNQHMTELQETYADELQELRQNHPGDQFELDNIDELEPDGRFGNQTANALRFFQLAYCLLREDAHPIIHVDRDVNASELLWERSKWICGPHTWKLLDPEHRRVYIDERSPHEIIMEDPDLPPPPGGPTR